MGVANSKGNVWARLLIILYGLGIVALGAYPLQKEYGGILAFLDHESAALANVFGQSRGESAGRGIAEEPPVTRSLNASRQDLVNNKLPETPQRTVDSLTTTDRKQLDKLINNL